MPFGLNKFEKYPNRPVFEQSIFFFFADVYQTTQRLDGQLQYFFIFYLEILIFSYVYQSTS